MKVLALFDKMGSNVVHYVELAKSYAPIETASTQV
jgi:hypothetical protein